MIMFTVSTILFAPILSISEGVPAFAYFGMGRGTKCSSVLSLFSVGSLGVKRRLGGSSCMRRLLTETGGTRPHAFGEPWVFVVRAKSWEAE